MYILIFHRLGYCSSLFTGINQSSLARLQLLQNAAARLLTKTSHGSHITPILVPLNWLPVKFRIDLRSSDQGLLSVHHSHFKSRGDHAFEVVAPNLWNSLSLSIKTAQSVACFKHLLKNHSYKLAFFLKYGAYVSK